jgi:transposase
LKRAIFLAELAKIPHGKRVWVDETGLDSNESYPNGWSPKGSRCQATKPSQRGKRVSVVAGLKDGKFLAPLRFNGTCTTALFNRWLEEILVPELAHDDWVILDNARFHQSLKTKEIIANAKCKILFLPPYSPEDNEIEHAWFPLKNTARKILATFLDINAAIDAAIISR